MDDGEDLKYRLAAKKRLLEIKDHPFLNGGVAMETPLLEDKISVEPQVAILMDDCKIMISNIYIYSNDRSLTTS